jgi:hypothetical protein
MGGKVKIKGWAGGFRDGEETKDEFMGRQPIDQDIWANPYKDGTKFNMPDKLNYVVFTSEDDWYFDEGSWEKDLKKWKKLDPYDPSHPN